jgi:N-glycosylase/DNA lyase
MSGSRLYRNIDGLAAEHAARKDKILARLADFAAVLPDEYFFELVYCLLTPQSSAVNAARAVAALREAGFPGGNVNVAEILADRRHYIRFHKTKARRLQEASEGFAVIRARLGERNDPGEARRWLVSNVKGLGWKEASHFLRNIGFRDLAILDRHILKNLKVHGVVRTLPRTLTPKTYLAIESRFRSFAIQVGIPMDELDLLFWSRETGEILK